MRAVNLLPSKVSTARRLPAPPVLVASVGTVILMAFLTVSFLSAGASVTKERTALESAQAQLLVSTPAADAVSPIVAQLPEQKEQRTLALTTALAERVAFDVILRDLSRLTPSDVWLDSLNAKVPDPTAPQGAVPTGLTVSGYTYSLSSVARFLSRLQVVPELTEVELGSSSLADINGRSVIRFTISADLRPSEASQ
jgi:Tfp pilus assembly protein PilN